MKLGLLASPSGSPRQTAVPEADVEGAQRTAHCGDCQRGRFARALAPIRLWNLRECAARPGLPPAVRTRGMGPERQSAHTGGAAGIQGAAEGQCLDRKAALHHFLEEGAALGRGCIAPQLNVGTRRRSLSLTTTNCRGSNPKGGAGLD